jgi:hypothetical protein|nr:phage tail protein [uncultured Dialister sp.]DAP87068.1 MAG TPA: baseplate protein [Caudoviricetes sp.]
MAVWNPFVITTYGMREISSAVLNGTKISITRLASSDASFAGVTLTDLRALPQEKQSFAVLSAKKKSDTQIGIEAVMNNVGMTQDYKIAAIGIYAQTANAGDEFLLAVKTASDPDTMPKNENGVVKTIRYKLAITMSNAEAIDVKIDMDEYVTRSLCNDLAHPIGTVVFTDGSYNPADKFGGTWNQIKGMYFMASGEYNGKTYKAGDIAGEVEHKISYNEMPRHGHTRGTMEITGSFWNDDSVYNSWYGTLEGAFGKGRYVGHGDLDSGGGGYKSGQIEFIASRGWTGITSIEGMGLPMRIMPYCMVVDAWKRTG